MEVHINLNSEFWHTLDQLVQQSTIIIDHPAGQAHPRYPELIYPLNYGYLENTHADDGDGVDIWLGKQNTQTVVAIIVTVDLFKRDSEIKILLGCDEQDMDIILAFHTSDQQQGMLIKRS